MEETTITNENATETTTDNIFSSITGAFQFIIDLIMNIIDIIRSGIQGITG